MTILILLGLLNGVAVSLSRTLNGRLASARGAMTASLANHLLGFGLLGALLILKGRPGSGSPGSIPGCCSAACWGRSSSPSAAGPSAGSVPWPVPC